ncbi:MAG: hypothetical protein J5J06_10400 [Phycisphaerae bacterium]|nr:hypothetical protein [Phycisphaerae bacterium]
MVGAWIVALFVVLSFLPFRSQIPPLIESDYGYQLIAAERMAHGEGLTSLPPAAPGQSWTWHGDWVFLTRWPAGYSALVGLLQKGLEVSLIEACRWIAVAAVAVSLVAWFLVIKQVARGVVGGLVAAVAAGLAVGVPSLLNPSTDSVLVALLPVCMLLVAEGVELSQRNCRSAAAWRLALGGLLAGGLCWIRYASVFVPAGIGIYLLGSALHDLRRHWKNLSFFALGAAVPMIALVVVNRLFGADTRLAQQFNLGTDIGFDFSWSMLVEAWRRATSVGFYEHRSESTWLYMLWPVVLAASVMCFPAWRRRLKPFFGRPVMGLAGAILGSFLFMIVIATVLFHDKFNFVGLDRYYLPVKPLYLLLFIAPVVVLLRIELRVAAALPLLLAGSWIVHEEWLRPYVRTLHARTDVTPLGAWSRCFEPGASGLYTWLHRQPPRDLVIVSNFHEFVALETGQPAVPVPESVAELESWLARIRKARGVERLRTLFVLDHDNRWRDYWIPSPEDIIRIFDLRSATGVPTSAEDMVFEYTSGDDEERNRAMAARLSPYPSDSVYRKSLRRK